MDTGTEATIRISPAAGVLPANTLRFYVHFPSPSEAYFDRDGLLLINGEGDTVPDPFLVFSQELWSDDGRCLTILMEPGRIKRGIGGDASHEPALVVGRSYCLHLTVQGRLARHRFRVGPAIREQLDEFRWEVVAPSAGRSDPAVVRFDRVIDAVLCQHELAVRSPSGALLQTNAFLNADGTMLELYPPRPWAKGRHDLLASSRLEDVCGNRLGEALDHDLGDTGRPRGAIIPFVVA